MLKKSSLLKKLPHLLIGKILQLGLIISMITVLVLQATSGAWATTIGTNFSSNGYKYIFSDNPEDIPSTNGYTIDQTLSSSYAYDIELYHHNNTGSTKRIGVALYNPNASSATITVYAKVIGYSNTDQSSEVDLTAPLIRDYQNGTGSTTLTIPAYGYSFLTYLDAPTYKLVNGKARIKPNVSNVRLRVFHGPTSATASQVFSYSRDSASGSNTTTGFFQYDGKLNTTTIDASTYPAFILSEWPRNLNTNEYETGTNVLGSSILAGNYGITYTITISNPGGKRLKITPNWGATGNNYERIVLYTPTYGWYTTTKLYKNDTQNYWLMATGTGSTFTFKYVLPGGNFGSMKFEVTN